jgi:hypothetical protein
VNAIVLVPVSAILKEISSTYLVASVRAERPAEANLLLLFKTNAEVSEPKAVGGAWVVPVFGTFAVPL